MSEMDASIKAEEEKKKNEEILIDSNRFTDLDKMQFYVNFIKGKYPNIKITVNQDSFTAKIKKSE